MGPRERRVKNIVVGEFLMSIDQINCILRHLAPGDNGCIEWVNTCDIRGYGRLNINGRITWIHRFIYQVFYDTIPRGMAIHHLCYNRRCCNIRHLQMMPTGDHLALHRREHRRIRDNEQLCQESKPDETQRRGPKPGKAPRGEAHASAKLSAIQIKEIRKLRASGYTLRHLSVIYGVTHQHISLITRGKRWEHLLDPKE